MPLLIPAPAVAIQGPAWPTPIFRDLDSTAPAQPPSASVPEQRSAVPSEHDGSLMAAALEEIECKRLIMEQLLEAGVLAYCFAGE
jgi:hypothetical protein